MPGLKVSGIGRIHPGDRRDPNGMLGSLRKLVFHHVTASLMALSHWSANLTSFQNHVLPPLENIV